MKIFDFFTVSRNASVASVERFPAIDTDAMSRRLRLKEMAADRGKYDLPPTDSIELDAVEQSIVNEIENEAKIRFSQYLDNQKTYADRASDAGIQALTLQIGTTVESAISDFERQTRTGTGYLHAQKRDMIDTELELKRFREAHGLNQPARNVEGQSARIGALIFIIAIESILNGYFFAKGSVFGYAGGVFSALFLAGLNVFTGVCAGRLIAPWLVYKHSPVKFVAALSLILYFAFAIFFNLAVAHYRNAVAGDPFQASSLAYASLVGNPFGIKDLESWALFLMGTLFSLAACYEGFRLDDPYPGYGSRARQNLAALDAYNRLKDELFGELDAIKTRAESTLESITRGIENRQGEFGYIVMKSHALKSEMLNYFVHLETAANTLLRTYRDENSKARNHDAPSHFHQSWVYNKPNLDGEVLPRPDRTALDAAVEKVVAEIPMRRAELYAAYRTALDEYKQIDELTKIEPQNGTAQI